jgi:hypothetical protein
MGYSTIIAPDQGMTQAVLSQERAFYQTYRGNSYSLTLAATTGTIAAGNIVGAGAAASTQFGLINPVASQKSLVLTKFGMGIISGTPAAGPVFHGIITTVPSGASAGTVRNNAVGTSPLTPPLTYTPSAVSWVSAAGAALTGATAPQVLRIANFSTTATAAASVNMVPAIEMLDGDIILRPGSMWLPLWSGAGTTLLNAYSISWYETGL